MSLLSYARNLRTNQTPWESKLWYHLRGNRFKGVHFKRQVPIGEYIVDFCSINKKLIIELDGSGHTQAENRIKDLERDKYFFSLGFKVLRFYNVDLDNNLEGVLEKILMTLGDVQNPTSPFIPPLGGEGKYTVEILKTRLDKFLATQLEGISRGQIQRDIEAGLVNVNGKVQTESDFVVRQGNEIFYLPSKKEELVPVNLELKVLYNDHGLLIIDKPAGLSVHPGAGFKGNTLAAALLYQFKDIAVVGEEGRRGIVHRLDKDTSGVILVARTQEMYEYLKDAFQERKIKKEYIALVLGKVEKSHGIIDTPIGKSKKDFRKYTTKGMIEPKDSLTEYWVLEHLNFPSPWGEGQGEGRLPSSYFPSLSRESREWSDFVWPARVGLGEGGIDAVTLIKVKLHTGRTHQIRVHMASIGHPLVGDSLYGHRIRGRPFSSPSGSEDPSGSNDELMAEGSDSRSGKSTEPQDFNRQFLHAKKIEVRLPDGTWIEAESDLPSDLKGVLISLNSKIVNNI